MNSTEQQLTTTRLEIDQEIISNLVLNGDISKMSNKQRVEYYKYFCESLGLNSLTQPFKILRLSGKEVLYATKDASEQLRKIYGVSIYKLEKSMDIGLVTFTAYARDAKGREDASSGAVAIEGLKGDALANAIMKAETKSKRRVTLSICGLGMLDETEIETIQGATIIPDEIPYDIDELHKEYITLYNDYAFRSEDKDVVKYHPDNWKKERTIENYLKAIEAIKIRINGLS